MAGPKIKTTYSIYCAWIMGLCVGMWMSTPLHAAFGVGVLNITNQTTPRMYVIGSSPIVLDPNLTISYDAAANSSYVRSWNNLTTLTAWKGGTIYVTMDPVPNGNLFDVLTCTLADASTMTQAYNPTTRTLTITAGALGATTVTYADIQNTLRTLTLTIKGQCIATRNIRLFFETPGFRFVNSRGGRIYAVAAQTAALVEALTWFEAKADIAAQPRRFGLKPYFASMTSAAENVYTALLTAELDGTNWIGARAITQSNGQWIWDDGPDYYTVFWNGGGNGAGGSAVDGRYHNWRSSGAQEPNGGASTTYIAAEIRSDVGGKWNDHLIGDPSYKNGGWLMEYGGMPTDANVIQVRVVGGNSLHMVSPY